MSAIGKSIFLTLAILWGSCSMAFAEKRVALVIGNSDYKNVARLTNPVNDAALVAAMLRSAGFDLVLTRFDANIADMRKVLREFGASSRDADVAVIYYAGHGIELDGVNYLIPTDATLETDTDVLDETVPLDRVLVAIEPARQLRLVILDACRDNPFSKTMKRTVASRSIGRGLAKIEPNNPNTMIAFAAKAGSTASDGDAKNSPFAVALVQHLPKPGLDLRKAFGFARDDVLQATSNRQEPFVYGSLGGGDVALVAAPVTSAASNSTDPNIGIRHDYEMAERIGTREAWDYFIATYPTGFYANLAQAQRNKLAAEEARLAATEKARLAAEEQARLAAEGARASEQAKALAQSKAAERERMAAELAKKAEEAKVAEAERVKAVNLAKAAAEAQAASDRQKKTDEANAKAAKEVAEDAKLAASKSTDVPSPGRVASFAASEDAAPKTSSPAQPPADIPRLLQTELRRVGCFNTAANGDWNPESQRSLMLFNRYAGTRFDVKVASIDALEVIKTKPARICPLVCEHGLKADGDRCVVITCRGGYRVGDDNECEKIPEKKPLAVREDKRDKRPDPAKTATTSKPQAQSSGQIFCNQQGCRPLRQGCYVGRGGPGNQVSMEICN